MSCFYNPTQDSTPRPFLYPSICDLLLPDRRLAGSVAPQPLHLKQSNAESGTLCFTGGRTCELVLKRSRVALRIGPHLAAS